MLVDNTAKLKNVMNFKQGSYYKFVALVRAKDYKNSSIKDIKEKINTLKEYYLNMPFNYYRI